MTLFGQPALPATRRGRILLFALLLIALVVRLALWTLPTHQPANDEVEYLAVARDLLAGEGWRFYASYPWLRAPLYPLYLAGCLWLFNDNAQLALLPNILLSVGQLYLLWLLGSALAPAHKREKVGLWTLALGTLLLTYATFANLWMAEVLWSVLWSVALLALLDWRVRRRWRSVVIAGLFLGLTILTRSLPLMFLPVLIIWMLWQERTRRGVIQVSSLIALCFAIVAPWTMRNWQAYGTPILVETGFAYNQWAFSEPPLELSEINRILSQIANPAERADYASAQGQALIAADPMILLRKPWRNSVYLWRVKPIEDRFIQANYYSDVGLAYFSTALIFDDLLYLVCLLAAAWALAHAQRDGRWWLTLLWVAYVVGSTMFTHGEARYRHFVWMLMLAYAAQTFAHSTEKSPIWQKIAIFVIVVIPVYIALAYYPWSWAGSQVARGWHAWQAERTLAANDLNSAEQHSLQAIEASSSADGWIRYGQIKALRGDYAGAEQALNTATKINVDYPNPAFALGQLWLERGELGQAKQAWANQYVDQTALLAVAWREHTRIPTSTLEIGDGLDVGLIDGFYPAEPVLATNARWTHDQATIRLPAGDTTVLTIRMANPRPPDANPAHTQICTIQGCTAVNLTTEWRTISQILPASPNERSITIKADLWQPPTDSRELGVLVDAVEVR